MKKDSFISKINYIKILKIAFGGTVAILIADILHLKYIVWYYNPSNYSRYKTRNDPSRF